LQFFFNIDLLLSHMIPKAHTHTLSLSLAYSHYPDLGTFDFITQRISEFTSVRPIHSVEVAFI